MSERKFLGEGRQHTVWESRRPKKVLKTAKLSRYLSLRLLGFDSKSIVRDFQEASELTKSSRIQVPKTRVISIRTRRFGFGKFKFSLEKGYIIEQEEIERDDSIDTRKILAEEKQTYLLDKFDINLSNFVASQGIVYWVDPVKGNDLRFLEKIYLVTPQQYAKVRLGLKRIFS